MGRWGTEREEQEPARTRARERPAFTLTDMTSRFAGRWGFARQNKIVISIVSGFLAGTIHVMAGPDHLAAVAPLSMDGKESSWRTGMRWGFGHAGGVILVGLLSLGLREVLPIHALSQWAERLVGVALLGVGLWGLHKAFRNRVHVHEHTHDGATHQHIHVHTHGGESHSSAEASRHSHTHTHAAFAIGTLHGLAGSSHFLGVLPALAFPSTAQAISYLAAYGVGTIAAMTGFSSAIGLVSQTILLKRAGAYRSLMVLFSASAMVVGGYWLIF